VGLPVPNAHRIEAPAVVEVQDLVPLAGPCAGEQLTLIVAVQMHFERLAVGRVPLLEFFLDVRLASQSLLYIFVSQLNNCITFSASASHAEHIFGFGITRGEV